MEELDANHNLRWECCTVNSAGIDVSKGKSTVAVFRPFNEPVAKPFEVRHTGSELRQLADYLKSLDGETRVVGTMSRSPSTSMTLGSTSAR